LRTRCPIPCSTRRATVNNHSGQDKIGGIYSAAARLELKFRLLFEKVRSNALAQESRESRLKADFFSTSPNFSSGRYGLLNKYD